MTDRPIIFSAPMVRALLEGRKTQTRRVLKPQPYTVEGVVYTWEGQKSAFLCGPQAVATNLLDHGASPYAPGDRLWVKENFCFDAQMDHVPPSKMSIYEPRGFPANNWIIEPAAMMVRAGRVRPSIHMPRWASRLTLIVTDVRAQQLQEISEADAVAEGIERLVGSKGPNYFTREITGKWSGSFNAPTAQGVFADLWNDINGPEAWDANPWVVALTFTVHRCNIDKMEARNDH